MTVVTVCVRGRDHFSVLIIVIQVNPIKLRRQKASYIFGYSISIPSCKPIKDPALLLGLPSELLSVPPGVLVEGSDAEGPFTDIIVPENFPPGSMMVFATVMTDLDPKLEELCHSGAAEACNDLDLVDLNVLLHRADGEERDATGMCWVQHSILRVSDQLGQAVLLVLTMCLAWAPWYIVVWRVGCHPSETLQNTTTSAILFVAT